VLTIVDNHFFLLSFGTISLHSRLTPFLSSYFASSHSDECEYYWFKSLGLSISVFNYHYNSNQNFFSTIPSLTISNVDFAFLFLLLKFIIFRIFLQSCQLKIVDYLFSCNVLRCGVCLGCNFLVDSFCNAFFSFSFRNMHIMCLTKCLTHCCISFK
jgi:hypothetical protein